MKVNIYKIIGKFRQDLVKVFNLVIVALTEVTLSYSYVSCFSKGSGLHFQEQFI